MINQDYKTVGKLMNDAYNDGVICFDAVTSLECMEHIAEPRKLVN